MSGHHLYKDLHFDLDLWPREKIREHLSRDNNCTKFGNSSIKRYLGDSTWYTEQSTDRQTDDRQTDKPTDNPKIQNNMPPLF